MNKVGVDTNVFIYSLNRSSIYHEQCLNFLHDIQNQLFTTTKNISEYWAVCNKLEIDGVIVDGFYQDIKKNTHICYPTEASLLQLEQLRQKYQPKGNRIYDLEVISILIMEGIDTIATINTDDFKMVSEITLMDWEIYLSN